MVISDSKLETDLPVAPYGTPIHAVLGLKFVSFKHSWVHLPL